jgi:hypothetical protein
MSILAAVAIGNVSEIEYGPRDQAAAELVSLASQISCGGTGWFQVSVYAGRRAQVPSAVVMKSAGFR